jgi:hypothetical protein
MVPSPFAVSLFLCDRVIIDSKSRNPSLINIFSGRAVREFPSPPERFSVFAALTDAVGRGIIELRVVDVSSEDSVFDWEDAIQFTDRFTVLNVHIELEDVTFPHAGVFAVQLFIDGEHIAESRLRVYEL